MIWNRKLGGLALGLASLTAHGASWQVDADANIYTYLSSTFSRQDSVLNPGNQIANLDHNRFDSEARLNLRVEAEAFKLKLRPILQAHRTNDAAHEQGYLSQWLASLNSSPSTQLAMGRELLTWGPAQFRSPSNPYYFNSGRSNPIRELSGIDVLRFSWTPDLHRRLQLAYVTGTGHQQPWLASRDNSWLMSATLRDNGHAGGLAINYTPGRTLFYGAYFQHSPSDEWLLYGEIGSGSRDQALTPSIDPPQAFIVQPESRRHVRQLLGGSYAFENGQSLTLEYLHNGDGFSRDDSRRYFDYAAANSMQMPASAQALGQAISTAPPLLGRNYLHLVWQNSMLDEQGYWRLMITRNFTDSSHQIDGYAETPVSRRASLFALGSLPIGTVRSELPSLIACSITLGLKLALP